MSLAYVGSETFYGAASENNTGPFDSSGADLLVAISAFYPGGLPTLGDNKGNTTWSGASAGYIGVAGGHQAEIAAWYVAAPNVGAGHSFSVGSIHGVTYFSAWSGSNASPLDVSNGYQSTDYTVTAAAGVTPSVDGSLVLTGLSTYDNTTSRAVDSGFSLFLDLNGFSANYCGLSVGVFIQTTAAPVTPTWTWGNGTAAAAVSVAFRPAPSGTPRTGSLTKTLGNLALLASGHSVITGRLS